MTDTEIKLYSAWYCPFAQRTWAALEYLGLEYTYEETDPYDKSGRWLEVSRRTGTVPVLEIRQPGRPVTRIPESLRTFEYLDDISELLPVDPLDRAEARFWLDQQGRAIIPYFYRFLKSERDDPAAREAREKMLSGLTDFARAMTPDGPYFAGDAPGAVDLAFAPFAYRTELLLSHYKDFRLPESGAPWARYHAWWRAMKSHSSFVGTMPERDTFDAKLLQFYLPYSEGRGQQNLTEPA